MSTWVLLRGLMRESRHWGEFPAVLSEEIAGATVVTLDLPGNGSLHRMASPTRVEDMAEFCRQELRARGLAPPYHLLALSLGAMVAVAWATRHPDEISRAVLINTSLRPFSPFYHRLRAQNYPGLLSLVLTGGIAKQEKLILRMTSCRGVGQEEILKNWITYQQQYPVSRRNALRQLAAAARYRAPGAKPPPPMLILASAMDQLVDMRCSHGLASRWQTGFAVHPSAGHDLPLDDGAWVARQVREFMVRSCSSG
jgi:pimeloyl-ACP methyl ester carboxylesterase